MMTSEKITCYINGIGILAPQKTITDGALLEEISTYDDNRLTCITPDFKEYINPVQLRRLSRMLRIGMTSATICLRDANLERPDGIITATALVHQATLITADTKILKWSEQLMRHDART